MALVDYNSSEDSDRELPQKTTQSSTKPKPSNKAIPKLVDSSNPGKIRVGVETLGSSKKDEDGQESERPTKKPKLGAGGLSDFNSLLPAPKRPAATNGSRGPGLGRGVNLKTGAAPGFSREPMVEEENNSVQDGAGPPDEVGPSSPETQDRTGHTASAIAQVSSVTDGSIPEQPPKKKVTMFKPLSVSRKPQKKKQQQPPPAPNPSSTATPPSGDAVPKEAPRASLFSVASEPRGDHDPVPRSAAHKAYQPMLYQPEQSDPDPPTPATDFTPEESRTASSAYPPQDQSLESIATSLNLTPSQKRQLLGRNASKSASSQHAIKVTNFNTDAEYASNEALRQAGEAVQPQPVRAITGGGKHSLKQLVNSAVGQKDALDQSFAEGTRNRKEGAAKYGW